MIPRTAENIRKAMALLSVLLDEAGCALTQMNQGGSFNLHKLQNTRSNMGIGAKLALALAIMEERLRASAESRAAQASPSSTRARDWPELPDRKLFPVKRLIEMLTDTYERFGDTCIYARDIAWGAVALNREADDKRSAIAPLDKPCERYGNTCPTPLACNKGGVCLA